MQINRHSAANYDGLVAIDLYAAEVHSLCCLLPPVHYMNIIFLAFLHPEEEMKSFFRFHLQAKNIHGS